MLYTHYTLRTNTHTKRKALPKSGSLNSFVCDNRVYYKCISEICKNCTGQILEDKWLLKRCDQCGQNLAHGTYTLHIHRMHTLHIDSTYTLQIPIMHTIHIHSMHTLHTESVYAPHTLHTEYVLTTHTTHSTYSPYTTHTHITHKLHT